MSATVVAALGLLVWTVPSRGAPQDDGAPLDRAFATYWKADRGSASLAADAILELDPAFDAVWRRLEEGRPYDAAMPTGTVTGRNVTTDGMVHHYTLVVPEDYDPSTPYPVRVHLHGGIGTERKDRGARIDPERIEPGYIYVFPSGWRRAQWWHANQIENVGAILDRLGHTYNVDENRVHLSGTSDGGSGVFFMASRTTTRWASCLSFIGHVAVAANPRMGTDGNLFVGNLTNKPFFVLNGGADRLYPAAGVVPYIDGLRQAGVTVQFRTEADYEHNLRWWPRERETIEGFVHGHVRDPLPDRLSWEVDRTDRHNRAHWVVVEALGATTDEPPASRAMFRRTRPSGRVDLVRTGNTIQASSWGVRRFRLLLSPAELDFDRPVRVITNGAVSFEGRVEPDVETLLRWAARDNDRQLLFGAELVVDVASDGEDGSTGGLGTAR